MICEWQNTQVKDLWVLDKLILSKNLGYVCGPSGVNVPKPSHYIVRPCVNAFGLGLGARKEFIEDCTDHLPPGYFWCEWFEGDHLSVDYEYAEPYLTVQGFKEKSTFTKWDRWLKIPTQSGLYIPNFIKSIQKKYKHTNAEFIGGRLIELHIRKNPDFGPDQKEYIPVWKGQNTSPPDGYEYIEDADVHGRIGAWVR